MIGQIVHRDDAGGGQLQCQRLIHALHFQQVLRWRALRSAGQLAGKQGIAGAASQFLDDLAVETVDVGQLADRHVGDFLDAGEPFLHQKRGDIFVYRQRRHELVGVAEQFFLLLAHRRFFVHDFQIPAGQLAGQTHVLAAATDGLGEVVFLHGDVHGAVFFVFEDGLHLGWRHGADGQLGRVVVPKHDVDLLARQFAGHRLNPRATHADARAHGVDAAVVGFDGDLGAGARIAGGGADFDDVFGDFRHLDLEQLDQHLWRGARENELGAARFRANFLQQRTHAVAHVEAISGNEILAGEDGFGVAAQIDDDAVPRRFLDRTANQLANTRFVQLHHLRALGFAHFLDDDLLRRLGGDAPELDGLHRHFVGIADAQRRVLLLRFFGSQFGVWVGLFVLFKLALRVDHVPAPERLVVAALAVDPNGELRVHAAAAVLVLDELVMLALGGHGQRQLNGLEDHLLGDALLVGDGLHHGQHFFVHFRHGSPPSRKRRRRSAEVRHHAGALNLRQGQDVFDEFAAVFGLLLSAIGVLAGGLLAHDHVLPFNASELAFDTATTLERKRQPHIHPFADIRQILFAPEQHAV